MPSVLPIATPLTALQRDLGPASRRAMNPAEQAGAGLRGKGDE